VVWEGSRLWGGDVHHLGKGLVKTAVLMVVENTRNFPSIPMISEKLFVEV
jgi:hypothetical protein